MENTEEKSSQGMNKTESFNENVVPMSLEDNILDVNFTEKVDVKDVQQQESEPIPSSTSLVKLNSSPHTSRVDLKEDLTPAETVGERGKIDSSLPIHPAAATATSPETVELNEVKQDSDAATIEPSAHRRPLFPNARKQQHDDARKAFSLSRGSRTDTPESSSKIARAPIERRRPQSAGSTVRMRSGNHSPAPSLASSGYLRETASQRQRRIESNQTVRTHPTPPRMKFGAKDFSKASRPITPISTVDPNRRKVTKRDKLEKRVAPKSISQLSVVMGLGTISVPSYKLTSLEGLGIRDDLKTLFLQNNYLVSFMHLGSQPSLEMIQISDNCIFSFYGLEHQPKLQMINIAGNPICNHTHFKLMCLMAVGPHIKKINKEPVLHREREFVKQFIAANPLVPEAIRSGWLLDMKQRTTEEFQEIIEDLRHLNMDDKDTILRMEQYRALLVRKEADSSGMISPLRQRPTQRHPTAGASLTSVYADNKYEASQQQDIAHSLHLEREIRRLRQELLKKNEEVKKEKVKVQEYMEHSLSVEELLLTNSIDLDNFTALFPTSKSPVGENVALLVRLTRDAMQLMDDNMKTIRKIAYLQFSRTSLLLENEVNVFRLHVRISGGEVIDLLSEEQDKATLLYKLLHLFITHCNKLKRQRREGLQEQLPSQEYTRVESSQMILQRRSEESPAEILLPGDQPEVAGSLSTIDTVDTANLSPVENGNPEVAPLVRKSSNVTLTSTNGSTVVM